jgi:hypothetical protein
VHAVEDDDALARRRPDDVAEHGAGLDRCELAGVADEDETSVGADGLSTRRAISDSDTIEVSSTITTSCGRRFVRWWRKRLWLPGRQPAAGAAWRRAARATGAYGVVDVEYGGLCVDRFLEPGGGLAGRRRQRGERWRVTGRSRLLGEQRDDARHGRRLAGAQSSCDDGEAAQHGGRGRQALAAVVGLAGEQGGPARRRGRSR